MDTRSLAQSAHPPTLQLSARLQRGIDLARARFEEIERIAPWTWRVPSCSGEEVYTVNLKHAACSCPDRPPEGERCKHVSAAAYVKAKTGSCAGCGRRFRYRDLIPVSEDSLSFFEGDQLCRGCARRHGVV